MSASDFPDPSRQKQIQAVRDAHPVFPADWIELDALRDARGGSWGSPLPRRLQKTPLAGGTETRRIFFDDGANVYYTFIDSAVTDDDMVRDFIEGRCAQRMLEYECHLYAPVLNMQSVPVDAFLLKDGTRRVQSVFASQKLPGKSIHDVADKTPTLPFKKRDALMREWALQAMVLGAAFADTDRPSMGNVLVVNAQDYIVASDGGIELAHHDFEDARERLSFYAADALIGDAATKYAMRMGKNLSRDTVIDRFKAAGSALDNAGDTMPKDIFLRLASNLVVGLQVVKSHGALSGPTA